MKKKPISERQLTANRRNAQKSTGPRTAEGRAVSKMNALKHGILSTEVLVAELARPESRREFLALQRRFWEDLQPVGPLEEMLVDQIVTAHWRLRRALHAEAGEIALKLDRQQRQRSRGLPPALLWMKWRASGDVAYEMSNSSLGLSVILGWLSKLQVQVEAADDLTAGMIEEYAGSFGGAPNPFIHRLREVLAAPPEATDETSHREWRKSAALAAIRAEITRLNFEMTQCWKEEHAEETAEQAAAMLPSPEALEKIMRYETKLERQMYRAMTQLERVKRMRRGEAIPAPLSVELSERA